MPDTLLTAALDLANVGFDVFPAHPATKRPLTDKGFHDATRELQVIAEWWSKWPHAMIAIATGPKSRMVVLDVDLKLDRGVDGFQSLRVLLKEEGTAAETMSARTPSGGRHYYFNWDPHRPIRNSVGTIGKGLDVRGEGGYVVAPPSLDRLSRPYAWDPSGPLYPAPSWL